VARSPRPVSYGWIVVDQKPAQTPAADNGAFSANEEKSARPDKWGTLVTAVSAIAAILALRRLLVVEIAAGAAILSPLAVWWLIPPVRRWPHWNRFVPYLTSLVIAASTVALVAAFRTSPPHIIYRDPDQLTAKAHEDRAAPIAIDPPPGGSGIGRCLTVQLSGRVPKGEELVVAHQLKPYPNWYFRPATAGVNDNSWTVSLTAGGQNMPKRSGTVTIVAILMYKRLANYLESLQPSHGGSNTYWISPKWPPSALVIKQTTTVVRVTHKGPKSCPQ
jgi:hypothetical protein